MRRYFYGFIALWIVMILSACAGTPRSDQPTMDLDHRVIERNLGTQALSLQLKEDYHVAKNP
jgi:hypothetical protein